MVGHGGLSHRPSSTGNGDALDASDAPIPADGDDHTTAPNRADDVCGDPSHVDGPIPDGDLVHRVLGPAHAHRPSWHSPRRRCRDQTRGVRWVQGLTWSGPRGGTLWLRCRLRLLLRHPQERREIHDGARTPPWSEKANPGDRSYTL